MNTKFTATMVTNEDKETVIAIRNEFNLTEKEVQYNHSMNKQYTEDQLKAASCSPQYPSNWLRKLWVCLFKRRKQWKLARAASKLTCYAWQKGDDALYAVMQPLHDQLWREVYVEENIQKGSTI